MSTTASLASDARGQITLREVRGPSAFGEDPRRLLRLVSHLARTAFALKYHGSVFGYAWSFLSPLLLFGVLYVAFTQIVRIGGEIPHYPALLLLNITLFQFFGRASSQALTSIVDHENFVRKTEFPRIAAPASIVLAASFTLALDLVVVFGFSLATGVSMSLTWLLIPALVLYLYVLTAGCSLLLSAAFVQFRDIAEIWAVGSRALFYASPVLFPIELYPDHMHAALILNPLAPLFAQSRVWLLDPEAPSYTETVGGGVLLAVPILIGAIVVTAGVWLFLRQITRAAEEL